MKQARGFLRRVTAGMFLLPLSLHGAETIQDFSSRITVNPDATMTVVETIRVKAENNQINHGIYRDFPQLYRGKWGLRMRTGFQVQSARRDGQDEAYHMENRENGKRVYLGRSDTVVPSGVYTYELTYTTDRQIGFFPEHDELYWNVTGNGWVFPIEKASATVILPAGTTAARPEAYTGRQGAKGRDFAARAVTNVAEFATTRPLAAYEGLTIVVQWPKGVVTAAADRSGWRVLIRDNPGVALAVAGLCLVMLYYYLVWLAVGRDPSRGTIFPLYEPPEGFSPAAVRALVHMHADTKGESAAIIDLAVHGLVTIEQTGSTYTLRRRSRPVPKDLPADESVLFSKLFGSSNTCVLKQENHATIKAAGKALRKALSLMLEKTYFVRNMRYWLPGLLFSLVPMAVSLLDARSTPGALFLIVWLSGWTVGLTVLLSQVYAQWVGRKWGQAVFMTLFALPFVGGECMGLFFLTREASVWVPGLFACGAALNGIFYHLLKAPTLAGRRILDRIEGFRMYLSVAEKDRLNLENPPQRTPELFEKFLPYALALNVEQKWAEQFEQVFKDAGRSPQTYSPSWYSGGSWRTLGLTGLAGAVGTSLAGAIASSSTAPGSSSGGGGGGSSGGGGGGGGGGGW